MIRRMQWKGERKRLWKTAQWTVPIILHSGARGPPPCPVSVRGRAHLEKQKKR